MPYQTSSTNLTGAATFTGAWLHSGQYDYITGTAFADQAGTLFIEQSNDAVSTDYISSITVLASTGKNFKEDVIAPYFRARYLNGATPQGSFRLHVKTRGGSSN